MIQRVATLLKPRLRALSAHQNLGFFVRSGQALVPAQGNPLMRLPQGLDLRASGLGFHNQPTRLELSSTGEAILHVADQIVVLGPLSQRMVERGWIVTGLRLRGALRFSKPGIVLMVPDREDIPYLLQVLIPCDSALVKPVCSPLVLAA